MAQNHEYRIIKTRYGSLFSAKRCRSCSVLHDFVLHDSVITGFASGATRLLPFFTSMFYQRFLLAPETPELVID